jgi:hypothetical protein
MSTVSFILQEPFTSFRKGIKLASWTKFCATLFGFNPVDLKWGEDHDYDSLTQHFANIFGPI